MGRSSLQAATSLSRTRSLVTRRKPCGTCTSPGRKAHRLRRSPSTCTASRAGRAISRSSVCPRSVITRPVGGSAMAEAKDIREATVIRRGDHLIVRVESDLTFDDAARIRQELRERMPLLSDVTVVNAAQLYVLRDEEVDRG